MSFGPLFIQPTNSLAICLGRKSLQEITFEIGMLGQYGLDINDPQEGPGPAGAAGDGLLGAADHLHHVCRLQEDRAGD